MPPSKTKPQKTPNPTGLIDIKGRGGDGDKSKSKKKEKRNPTYSQEAPGQARGESPGLTEKSPV